jgi:hypothetical protein
MRSDVLKLLNVKSLIFSDVTPYRQHFGGKYCVHLHDRRIGRLSNNGLLAHLPLDPEDAGRIILKISITILPNDTASQSGSEFLFLKLCYKA